MGSSRPGFTLIEITIVIGIMAVLMAMIWPRIRDAISKGKEFQARSTMLTIQQAVTEYDFNMGRVPTTKEGLTVLLDQRGEPNWRGPYLRGGNEIPRDPWNREFDYNAPPVEYKQYKQYEIISRGANPDDPRSAIHVGQ